MKEKFSSAPILTRIAEHDRATKLLQAAWMAIESIEMRNIGQAERCRYLGIAPGTWINWTNKGTQLTQIEAMLRLLERLPDCGRNELISRFGRLYPTIESTHLNHEFATRSQLRHLLHHRHGLSFIQGASDSARTFVVTALGHSMKHRWPKAAINGVDVHSTDWLVPVEGVAYLSSPNSKRELVERVTKVWPKSEDAVLVILNGVWNCLPDLQREIVSRGKRQHVIVADSTDFDPRRMPRRCQSHKPPIRLLELRDSHDGRIHIEFHAG